VTDAILVGARYDELARFPSGLNYTVPIWGPDGGITPWEAGMVPVPEPSQSWLIATGCLALAGLATTRRR